MDSKPVPWFAPKVSPALNTIVRNLGHRVDKSKGDVLYETGSMFEADVCSVRNCRKGSSYAGV